jgi:hypothetical protein
MSDPIEDAPCARGCEWAAASEDEQPRPKPAKHGHLCNSDFYRVTAALKLVPDLMANMRASLFSMGAADYSERVTGGGGEAPAPLNVGQLDAADELFAKLATWIELFTAEFDTTMWPPISAWATERVVLGSRSVSVELATRQTAQMVTWLQARLDRIFATDYAVRFHDDITNGWDDNRGIFALSAQYGVAARPVPDAEKRECPLCGAHEVFLKLPNSFDPEYAVICGRCGWVAETDFHAKKTGRTGYATFLAPKAGICVVCVEPYEAGSLINRIEGMTLHNGCNGIVETPEQREEHNTNREVGHPKAMVVHVGQPRAVLAGVALVDPPGDLRRIGAPGLVRGRAGVGDGSRESSGPAVIEPGAGRGKSAALIVMDEVRAIEEVPEPACPNCWLVLSSCDCGVF